MKILYLDCGMGAAGDMLTAALLELLPNPDVFVEKLNALGIPGVKTEKEKTQKCGITGTHICVKVHGTQESNDVYSHSHEHNHSHHSHHSMEDIRNIVTGRLALPAKVQEDVLNVYALIAKAESKAHGVDVNDIHFHEVGTMDAIADITAVCMLMEELRPDEVVVSPVHVGCGQVKCAHGILPVPAPATAYILQGAPIYSKGINGELCTPTGAALLKYFATRFGDMPEMAVHAIGYGMGSKDFEAANCVRALWGETADSTHDVIELSCNVDDMTAEEIGFAAERFFEGGAKDVYTVPIGMKKGRPGTLINVMCRPQDESKMVGLMYKHTSTTGVRKALFKRFVLDRKTVPVKTRYGEVRIKRCAGYGVEREKPEYDDIARIAKENNLSFAKARELLKEEQ